MKTPVIFSTLALCMLATAGGEPPSGFEVAGLKFEVPAAWKAEEVSSPMRKAQFAVGGAEVVVFYFGKGRGGGVEANVARWLKQFEEPEAELAAETATEEVGGGKVTTVMAKGTFLSGPPFGDKVAKPGYALRGAIVECPEGPVFLKMTGPEAEVAAAAGDFDKVVRSGLAE